MRKGSKEFHNISYKFNHKYKHYHKECWDRSETGWRRYKKSISFLRGWDILFLPTARPGFLDRYKNTSINPLKFKW